MYSKLHLPISLSFSYMQNFPYIICFLQTWMDLFPVSLSIQYLNEMFVGQQQTGTNCKVERQFQRECHAGRRYDRAAWGGLQDKHKWFTAGVWGKHERGVEKGGRGGEGSCGHRVGVGWGGFAAMTTDGGGSKQMSTSWQTGARVAEPLRDRWTSRSTVGLQSHCEAKQACAYRTQTLSWIHLSSYHLVN